MNGDDDRGDEVLAIVDRASGEKQNTQRLGCARAAAFSYPALATKDDTVALLEREGSPKTDANGDHDVSMDLACLHAVEEHAARDGNHGRPGVESHSTSVEALVNGRSLALSNGLLVYRTDHLGTVVVPASTNSGTSAGGASFAPAILSPSVEDTGFIEVVFASMAQLSPEDRNAHTDLYLAVVDRKGIIRVLGLQPTDHGRCERDRGGELDPCAFANGWSAGVLQ